MNWHTLKRAACALGFIGNIWSLCWWMHFLFACLDERPGRDPWWAYPMAITILICHCACGGWLAGRMVLKEPLCPDERSNVKH